MWVSDQVTIDSFGNNADYRISCKGKMVAEKASFEEAMKLANSLIAEEEARAIRVSDERQAAERKKAEDDMIYNFFHSRGANDSRRIAFEEFNAPKWRKRANR